MIKKLIQTSICIALTSSLIACANLSNQDVGVVTGGLVGGAVGSLFGSGSGKIVAAVGGSVLGAVIGGAIGHSMDKVDQMQVNRSLESVPTGQTRSWHNPDNGNSYSVTPTKTYYQNRQPCREFVTNAIIGGKRQRVYGHACRMADGSWQMAN